MDPILTGSIRVVREADAEAEPAIDPALIVTPALLAEATV
jgi:hypothetical protein